MSHEADVEYVLPLRWDLATSEREAAGLSDYLRWLATVVDVTVVDGSTDEVFARHRGLWADHVRHIRPDGARGLNGKVTGVVTGVVRARHERVVVADDDVRYDARTLTAVASRLDHADVVRPQCVFDPPVWHTRWDTARILVNRAVGHDFPGTHALRRSTFLEAGGYDDAVLFENLEMTRTLVAAGARVEDAPSAYVHRVPPSTSQFLGQRIRQAYDDFAQPARLLTELALLPALALSSRRRPALLAVGALASVAVAEVGRRRAGGQAVFERTAALWAPLWVLERSVCVWLAVLDRATGGARYGATRLPLAAHSVRTLRRNPRPPLHARSDSPLEDSVAG
jgi:hypothetical protein